LSELKEDLKCSTSQLSSIHDIDMSCDKLLKECIKARKNLRDAKEKQLQSIKATFTFRRGKVTKTEQAFCELSNIFVDIEYRKTFENEEFC